MNEINTARGIATICILVIVSWSCSPVAQADFRYGPATPIPNVSLPGAGWLQISPDGLELYFAHASENQCQDLWVARRATTNEPWGTPVRLEPPLNSPGPVGGSCISADGLEFYFGDGFPEHYTPPGCVANPGGCGGGDLWVSRRAAKRDAWGTPQNLGPTVNTASYEDHPSLSADGLSLYFCSNRLGAFYDIWVTTRLARDGAWGPPVRVSWPGNWPMYRSTPFISPDSLSLYFSYGGYTPDIYVTKRSSTDVPWERPVLFTPVNSPGAEWHLTFSQEDSTLYFVHADNFYAVGDLWQVTVIPTIDFNSDGKVDESDLLVMTQHWGEDFPRCDIGPMGWGDGVVNEKDLKILAESLMTPGSCTSDVPRDAILSWATASFDMTYDVYFGTSAEAVRTASRVEPQGVLVSEAQSATTYDLPGLLEFSGTYYWRLDFVIPGPTPTVYEGPVLSFTTEAYTRPIKNVTATASSAQANMGPEKTVDGSRLDANDGHSMNGSDMLLSNVAGPQPAWIQYQFDKIYALHEVWVWNSNSVVEPAIGFGAKTVEIEYSPDGTTWTLLANVPEFTRAPGQPGYVHNTTVSFGGVSAQYVKLTIEKAWGSVPSVGLSEVRFFYVPDRLAAKP
jgi:hypothetical protein